MARELGGRNQSNQVFIVKDTEDKSRLISSPELFLFIFSEAAASVGKGKFGKDLLSIHWNGGKMRVDGEMSGWSLCLGAVHPELRCRVERACGSQGRMPG